MGIGIGNASVRTVALARLVALLLSIAVTVEVALGDDRARVLNQNAIGVMAGESAWVDRATILARTVQHVDGIRVLPIAGTGSLQALQDLRFLKGVDAIIIPADTLFYAEGMGLSDPRRRPVYLAQSESLPLVLIARKEVASVTALAGKRLCTGPVHSATFATGELLFGSLGIPFTRVALTGSDAIAALMNGEADAALLLGADYQFADLEADKFHVLGLPVPAGLESIYTSSHLDSDLMRGLTFSAESIETIAVPLVLAATNWSANSFESGKLKRIVKALFNTRPFNSLATDGTPSAEVPIWKPYAAELSAQGETAAQNRLDSFEARILQP